MGSGISFNESFANFSPNKIDEKIKDLYKFIEKHNINNVENKLISLRQSDTVLREIYLEHMRLVLEYVLKLSRDISEINFSIKDYNNLNTQLSSLLGYEELAELESYRDQLSEHVKEYSDGYEEIMKVENDYNPKRNITIFKVFCLYFAMGSNQPIEKTDLMIDFIEKLVENNNLYYRELAPEDVDYLENILNGDYSQKKESFMILERDL